MKHDRSLLAMFLFNLSFIPVEIITQIAKHLHLTTVSGLEAMSMLWIPEGSLILGVLSGLGIGCWNGVIIYYSTKIWGTDYFPLKSMLMAMTGESLNFVHSFAAACAGLLLGYLFKKYLFVLK